MNRLVIIGNGFDLAHGLPTRYKDFIDDYWENIKDTNHNELVTFNLGCYGEFNGHKNLNDLIDLIANINSDFRREGIEIYKFKEHLQPLTDNRIQILQYKNVLFKLINQRVIENWVDVENEYYRELKEIVKSSVSFEDKKRHIRILNKEFEEVKNLLEKYLKEKIIVDKKRIMTISNLFKINSGSDEYFSEFPSQDFEELKDFYNEYNEEKRKQVITYCLNFNYTTMF
nr:AbiH family protein [uncultured Flavobacterium sp.]